MESAERVLSFLIRIQTEGAQNLSKLDAELAASHDRQLARLKNLKAELTSSGAGANGLNGALKNLGSEAERTAKSTGKADAALAGLFGTMGPVGDRLEKLTTQHRLLRSHGIDYVAAGAVGLATAFAVEGAKAVASFDKLASEIQQQTGASRAEAERLVTIVKDVATSTPASFEQITQAVAAQYRLFGDNAKVIKANTDLFLAFAEKAQGQVVPTITGLSAVMRDFHPKGMDVVDVMDQLVNLADKSQRPLSGYLGVLTRFGPQLQAMGFGLKQSIGLFEAMSRAGVDTTMMGRGLASAISFADKAIKDARTSTADHSQKLEGYRLAVDQAQIRVNKLRTEIAAGTGNQQQLNDELQVAQGRLDLAKQKLDSYTASAKNAAFAHETVGQVLQTEIQRIETARSRNDALKRSPPAANRRPRVCLGGRTGQPGARRWRPARDRGHAPRAARDAGRVLPAHRTLA